MKKYVLFLLGVVTLISCEKEEIINRPTPPISVVVTSTPTPKPNPLTIYKVMIINNHPTKEITGLYIDGILQELDSGSYPVGYNDTVYALEHTPICEYVYAEGMECQTPIFVEYEHSPEFNSIVIERYHNTQPTRLEQTIPINRSGPVTVWWQHHACGPNQSGWHNGRRKNIYPWTGALVVRAK